MYASTLLLDRRDVRALRIKDAYSLHRVIYSLYDDHYAPNNDQGGTGRILYADKGGDAWQRTILTLANREPVPPQRGAIYTKPVSDNFVHYDHYGFEIIINPVKRDHQSGRIKPFKHSDHIADWFASKAPLSWGFEVHAERLTVEAIGVQRFRKNGHTITHGYATLKGVLTVKDREQFIHGFKHGLGRGRAFGLGLLQIVPLMG